MWFSTLSSSWRQRHHAQRLNDYNVRAFDSLIVGYVQTPLAQRPLELLFAHSVRSFLESPVARDCHLKRVQILEQLAQPEAAAERGRAQEYVPEAD